MINVLTGLGYGIIGFAVLIGIGLVFLSTLGSTVSSCPAGYAYNANGSGYVFSTNTCCYANTSTCSALYANSTSPSQATTQLNTVAGYLGVSGGGLASFIPLVIIIVIGLLFLGMFMTKKGKNY